MLPTTTEWTYVVVIWCSSKVSISWNTTPTQTTQNEDECHNYKFIWSKHLGIFIYLLMSHSNFQVIYTFSECYRLSHLAMISHIFRPVEQHRTIFNLCRQQLTKKAHTKSWTTKRKKKTINWNRPNVFTVAKTSQRNIEHNQYLLTMKNKFTLSRFKFDALLLNSNVIIPPHKKAGKCLNRFELISFTHSIKITITVANVVENNSITLECEHLMVRDAHECTLFLQDLLKMRVGFSSLSQLYFGTTSCGIGCRINVYLLFFISLSFDNLICMQRGHCDCVYVWSTLANMRWQQNPNIFVLFSQPNTSKFNGIRNTNGNKIKKNEREIHINTIFPMSVCIVLNLFFFCAR